ncbi:TRAP transporter small permease [Pararhodobacter marinus]|uniref:TRAP transporter small permease n=1 Tax=Pararhodobacter marinus TaxID=2184063 RepID=UPI0035188C33
MTLISRLCRLHDGLTDGGFLLSTLGLFLMVAIYCAEVVARYFLNAPLDWANDTFSNVLCVSLFTMVPHATRAMAHIEINLVPELLPTLRRPLARLTALAGTLICGFVTWMAWSETLRHVARGILTEQNHPVPVWWMSIWISWAFGSSTLYFLRGLTGHAAVRPVSFVRPGDVADPTGGSA